MMRRGRKMGRGGFAALATRSAVNPNGLPNLPPELYTSLWMDSGVQISNGGQSGYWSLSKGSSGAVSGNSVLYTHSSLWPADTLFSLEIWLQAFTSGLTNTAQLWDITTNTAVVSVSITGDGTNSGLTAVRSGKVKLTAGHQYGVKFGTTQSSSTCYACDAFLVAFSNSQILSDDDIANITMGILGQRLFEAQIPLWVHSYNTGASTASASRSWLQKGTTTLTTNILSSIKLINLSNTWSPTQQFAFEAALLMANGTTSGNIGYASLWDVTSGYTEITASKVQTTATISSVQRSGAFNLTPGHQYAVGIYTNTGTYAVGISKAHLVPLFP